MISRLVLIALPFIFFTIGGATIAQMATKSQCSLVATGEEGRGIPAVTGDRFLIPDINIVLSNLTDPTDTTPRRVNVFYIWKWWESPFPEHPDGAWNDITYTLVECVDEHAGRMHVPSIEIVPKGWNGSGKPATDEKIPRFDHVEIGFEMRDCAPRITLNPREVKRLFDHQLQVKLSCSSRTAYKFRDLN